MAPKTWGEAPFTVAPKGRDPFVIRPAGRVRWALECPIAAGPRGRTSIHTPGPRWSDYVRMLRALGVLVETVFEDHGGAFPGHHGRTVLRAPLLRFAAEDAR